MTLEQYILWLENEVKNVARPYWIDLAHQSFKKGWYREILGRHDDDIYLMRFWINQPQANTKGSYSSRNSLLLHHFLKPDDDKHLHNHPWAGRSTILSGGYVEETQEALKTVKAFDSNMITSDKYHCVKSIDPNTWSLVHTGDKESEWGFLVNGVHQHYVDYLEEAAQTRTKLV